MTDLYLVALATFTVWEALLTSSPWRVPPALQPLVVVGLAAGGSALPHHVLLPVAAAGLVAVLHALLRSGESGEPLMLRRGRQASPPGVGSRIPPLP